MKDILYDHIEAGDGRHRIEHLGWQESLRLLAQLVEAEIPDQA
jgi:hypothetical protein